MLGAFGFDFGTEEDLQRCSGTGKPRLLSTGAQQHRVFDDAFSLQHCQPQLGESGPFQGGVCSVLGPLPSRVGAPAFIFMCERATVDECHLPIFNIHANGKADVESCLDTDVGFGAKPVPDIDMRIGADLQLSTAIIYLL